jgi:hypothetical protein
MVFQMLVYCECYKKFALKGVQTVHIERWVVCTLLSVNIFVTPATQ